MNFRWPSLNQLPRLLSARTPNIEEQAARIQYMERNVGLPIKAAVILILCFLLFFSRWFDEATASSSQVEDNPPLIELEIIRRFFLIYVVINAGVASLLLGMRHLPLTWIQWTVYAIGLIDTLFFTALAVVTGGADSVLYWVFLALIVRNAVSNAVVARQVILNLIVTFCYFLLGVADVITTKWREAYWDLSLLFAMDPGPIEVGPEPFLLRLCALLLLTICCAGVQVLFDKQRMAEAEARESMLRQQQLQATGRLAAEIAHQLKNPLGIINNAAFTLQRTVKEGKTITQQIQMIREEVEKSDRIITELMGYAQLTEGRVERVVVAEELDKAIDQVFPAAAKYDIQVHRDYAAALPPLLMQRNHLTDVFVNLLQNAREAMNGKGHVHVAAQYGDNHSVVVSIADDGPGIAPERLPKIFEPYFTTKEKGTGLGLAIVRHNTEIYGGSVEVESELGKGTRFTITLPAKTLMRIRK